MEYIQRISRIALEKGRYSVHLMQAGFTLIELLVVIGILGILATTAIVLINPTAQLNKANDGVRKADLLKLQSALELYRSDNTFYPPFADYASLDTYLVTGSKRYINSLPQDPKETGSYEGHATPSGCDNTASNPCTGYTLWACLDYNPNQREACEDELRYTVTNP